MRARPLRLRGPVGLLLVLLLGLVLAPAAHAGSRGVSVTAVLTDDRGAPAPDVLVRIESFVEVPGGSWSTSATSQARTGSDGRVVLSEVHAPTDGRDAVLRVSDDRYMQLERQVGDVLRAALAGPRTATIDVDLRARSAILRGRVAVRGASLGPAQVTAANPDGTVQLVADADAQGRYELRVSGGHWKVTAESRYGLPTRWPDLPLGREDAPDVVVQSGESRDGLDFSLRARLAGPGTDEYGTWYRGHDPAQESAPATSYPRDTYRSVLSPEGPLLSITAAPHHEPSAARNLRPGELLTFGTGPTTVPVAVGVRNTGDDTVFFRDARFDGGDAVRYGSCNLDLGTCGLARLLPGQSATLRLWMAFATYRFRYATTFLVPGGRLRIPLQLRNVAPPGWGTDGDLRMPADWAEHAPPDQLALAKAAGGGFAPSARAAASGGTSGSTTTKALPAPGSTAKLPTSRLGKPSLSRTRLSARFPLAGRATIRIDREVAPRGRDGRPARFRTVARVTLRAARPGIRRARVRRLVPGRYRMRVQAWIGGAPLDARTVTVRVGR